MTKVPPNPPTTTPKLLTDERRVIDDVATRFIASPEVTDDRPTVLFLHGFTDSADTWRVVLERYADQGRRAWAVDLPAHGFAGEPRRRCLSAYDAFVRAAVEAVDDGAGVVVVGNSLGGLLALRAAAAEPSSSLRGVVAIGPPGDRLHPALEALPALSPVVQVLLRLPIPHSALQRLAGTLYARIGANASLPDELALGYTSHVSRRQLRRVVRVGGDLFREMQQTRTPVGSIGIPVAILWGSEDAVCPIEGANVFQGLPLTVHRGGAHCPQLLEPDVVLAAVQRLEDDFAAEVAS
ncbi:alpha/beta hydrolase [Nocardioides sp. LML1-1-1.1]